MSVLEGKNMADACDEVSKKLVPTWKVSQRWQEFASHPV